MTTTATSTSTKPKPVANDTRPSETHYGDVVFLDVNTFLSQVNLALHWDAHDRFNCLPPKNYTRRLINDSRLNDSLIKLALDKTRADDNALQYFFSDLLAERNPKPATITIAVDSPTDTKQVLRNTKEIQSPPRVGDFGDAVDRAFFGAYTWYVLNR